MKYKLKKTMNIFIVFAWLYVMYLIIKLMFVVSNEICFDALYDAILYFAIFTFCFAVCAGSVYGFIIMTFYVGLIIIRFFGELYESVK